jgi:hypothetical protein
MVPEIFDCHTLFHFGHPLWRLKIYSCHKDGRLNFFGKDPFVAITKFPSPSNTPTPSNDNLNSLIT